MHPATLPPGSIVGSWRLLALASQGSFGVVFRAESTTAPESGPVALKFALQPGDPRFALEAKLLSRMQHPNLPRLRDSGEWSSSGGATYSFLVMDWVEGLPLYSWARLQPRSSREVLRVLVQGASALHAIHAAGGLHRDVKGDHFLVRPDGGHAVLVDFGSCTFHGAPAITRNSGPPSTPQYLSPQAQLHQWRLRGDPAARYEVSAADDVYALGVTAYRLVTGRYPLFAEEFGTDDGLDGVSSDFPELVPADALVRLSPELARWIRQMLSVGARGPWHSGGVGCGHEALGGHRGPRGGPAHRSTQGSRAPQEASAIPPTALGCSVARGAPRHSAQPPPGGPRWRTAPCAAGTALLRRHARPSATAHAPWEQATSGLGELTLPEPLSPAEPDAHS